MERYSDSNKSFSPLRRPSSRSSSTHSLSIMANSPPGLTSRYVELTGRVELPKYLVRGIARHQTFLLALVTPCQALGTNFDDCLPLELYIIELEDNKSSEGPNIRPERYTVVAHESLGSKIENAFGKCPILALGKSNCASYICNNSYSISHVDPIITHCAGIYFFNDQKNHISSLRFDRQDMKYL